MRMIRKLSALILLLVLAMAGAALAQDKTVLLQSKNWDPVVKQTLNDAMTRFGKTASDYDPSIRPYAVFDFDNTVAILDVEEQLAIYQLETLSFAIPADRMYDVLTTGISNPNAELGGDYGKHTVASVAKDAAEAYKKLCAKGWVQVNNYKDQKNRPWLKSSDWQEFATKARWLYSAIGDSMDVSVSYPWITYWFTGMTPAQVHDMAYTAFVDYAQKSKDKNFWKKLSWTSPRDYPGARAGQLTVSFNQGVTVSPELLELFAALEANGIDAWICSASFTDVITAAVKAFNIPGVNGVVAMTNKKVNGVYVNEYDYDFHAQTQGPGKAESLDKLVRPLYRNAGPMLVAFDSQGDFNFCTVYKDTAVGLGLNRARKDDAGLLAAIAVYQNKKNITLEESLKAGDTRYVLQGRNENGGYLWARPEIQALGKDKPVLLSSKAEGWLKMLESGTTPKQLLDQAPTLTGKLKTYEGYKTR